MAALGSGVSLATELLRLQLAGDGRCLVQGGQLPTGSASGQFSAWLIISAARVIKLPICSFGNYPNKLAAIQRVQGQHSQSEGNERAIMRGVTEWHGDPSTNLFSFRAHTDTFMYSLLIWSERL